ncbi:MAG: A24 family peptidase [Planctomycetota bacterium]
MQALLNIPLALRLMIVLAISAGVASLLNAAIYAWSWERRWVSPWQRPPVGVGPRSWLDRLPVYGWLRLRRDEAIVGKRFWLRPMAIELGFAVAMAALYWWEVERLGLLTPQLAEWFRLAPAGPPTVAAASIAGPLHWQFLSHAILASLMTIATFIDFDERIIPDEVTFPGTLVGLLLATLAPLSLLPGVQLRAAAPVAGVVLEEPGQGGPQPIAVPGGGGRLFLEPVHAAAPNQRQVWQEGQPNRGSLLFGLGCFGLWCFALTDRRWPGRGPALRNLDKKLNLVLARVRRDLSNSPLRETLVAGGLLICMVWFTGGPHWLGLLSALVGMIGGGLIVWAVRIIGTAVLRREAMGFGDVTLMMMVGAFVGWQACPIIFFLAPAAGLVLAILNLVLRGDAAIPYGPFLCLATAGVVVGWGWVWGVGQQIYSVGWLVPVVLLACFVLLGVLLGLLQGLKALLGVAGHDEE